MKLMMNKEVKIETIDSTPNIKGVEKINTVTPEVIEVPDYDYGNPQNDLDYNVALRNKPSLATVATSGDYDDLSNKPSLATVATTGDYDDLTNKPTAGGSYYCSTGTRASGTGTEAITGVGFQPTMILIKCVYAGSPGGYSEGQSISASAYNTVYQYQDGSGNLVWSYSSRMIEITDGTDRTRATIESIDSDGFTLNWSVVDLAVNYIFQCYG